jgi:hypothetical protein
LITGFDSKNFEKTDKRFAYSDRQALEITLKPGEFYNTYCVCELPKTFIEDEKINSDTIVRIPTAMGK